MQLFVISGVLFLTACGSGGSQSASTPPVQQVPPVQSACSGSGTTWTCPSGAGSSDVQTAINSASDTATITFAAGSYPITGLSLNNRNGVTLICASVGTCTITGTGDIFTNDFCNGADKTNLMRVSGFTFTGTPGTASIWWYCESTFTLRQVRIDNNTFSNIGQDTIAMLFGEASTPSHAIGVVDHNVCTGTANFICMKKISGGNTWATGLQGTANNIFFEDNVCNFTTYPGTGSGCIDAWLGDGIVFRFNTVTNSRMVNHSYCHGGPPNSEVYLNVISNAAFTGSPDYRNIHFQGSGEMIAWGNQVENGSGNAITIQHFRSDSTSATTEGDCNSVANGTVTGSGADPAHANDGNRSPIGSYYGYPAWHQPGRDGSATLRPVYLFLNHTAAGVRVDFSIESGSYTDLGTCADNDANRVNCHIRRDRDLYYAPTLTFQTSPTSPFNGTSGVGMGTLANLPTTCTPTSEALDTGQGGVGYWATDQGSWNKSPSNSHGVNVNGADGVLYRCSATNTWTIHYMPYTYPHPLQAP